MSEYISPPNDNRKARVSKRTTTPASAAKETPLKLTPVRAVAVLWLLTTSRPEEFSLRSFRWELIAQAKLGEIAARLAQIGILKRVRRCAATAHWTDAYRLAPLDEPLDNMHSRIVKPITDYMKKHTDDSVVAELLSVPGLASKLLGPVIVF